MTRKSWLWHGSSTCGVRYCASCACCVCTVLISSYLHCRFPSLIRSETPSGALVLVGSVGSSFWAVFPSQVPLPWYPMSLRFQAIPLPSFLSLLPVPLVLPRLRGLSVAGFPRPFRVRLQLLAPPRLLAPQFSLSPPPFRSAPPPVVPPSGSVASF